MRTVFAVLFVFSFNTTIALANTAPTTPLYQSLKLGADLLAKKAPMVQVAQQVEAIAASHKAADVLAAFTKSPELLESGLQGEPCLVQFFMHHPAMGEAFTGGLISMATALMHVKEYWALKAYELFLGHVSLPLAVDYFFLEKVAAGAEHWHLMADLITSYIERAGGFENMVPESQEAVKKLVIAAYNKKELPFPNAPYDTKYLNWAAGVTDGFLQVTTVPDRRHYKNSNVAFWVLDVVGQAPVTQGTGLRLLTVLDIVSRHARDPEQELHAVLKKVQDTASLSHFAPMLEEKITHLKDN